MMLSHETSFVAHMLSYAKCQGFKSVFHNSGNFDITLARQCLGEVRTRSDTCRQLLFSVLVK